MENNENNNDILPVVIQKRKIGRPKKNDPPREKPEKKPIGRPRKYEKKEYRSESLRVKYSDYKRLLEIEKKYNDLVNLIK
jgi:hypothetical protein